MTLEDRIADREMQHDDRSDIVSALRWFAPDSTRCCWDFATCFEVALRCSAALEVACDVEFEARGVLLDFGAPSTHENVRFPRTVIIPASCHLNLFTRMSAVEPFSDVPHQSAISESPFHLPVCKTYPMKMPRSILSFQVDEDDVCLLV